MHAGPRVDTLVRARFRRNRRHGNLLASARRPRSPRSASLAVPLSFRNHFVPASDDEMPAQTGRGFRQAGGRHGQGGHDRPPAAAREARGRGAVAAGPRHDPDRRSRPVPVREAARRRRRPHRRARQEVPGGWYPFAREGSQTRPRAGRRCRGSGSRSRRRTTWRTSSKAGPRVLRRRGTSC